MKTLIADKPRSDGKRYRFNSETGRMEEAPLESLFLRGPIPMDWLSRAAALPGKTLHLAIAINWLAGMSRSSVLILSRKSLELLCIGPDAKADALQRLESHGLIRVERSPGKRHRIEILPVQAVKPNDFGKKFQVDD